MEIEVLREYLTYNESTGKIIWIKRSNPLAGPGDEAGRTLISGRYRKIQLHGKSMLAHRVAWALHYGEWPRDQIDHINGDGNDNRISNLRCVSKSENMRNLTMHRNGKKFGVHSCRGKWHASLRRNNKNVFIGSFKTQDEASAAILGYMMGAGLAIVTGKQIGRAHV